MLHNSYRRFAKGSRLLGCIIFFIAHVPYETVPKFTCIKLIGLSPKSYRFRCLKTMDRLHHALGLVYFVDPHPPTSLPITVPGLTRDHCLVNLCARARSLINECSILSSLVPIKPNLIPSAKSQNRFMVGGSHYSTSLIKM